MQRNNKNNFSYIYFVKKFVLILILVFHAIGMIAQNSKLSLITCDPGDELYSSFGHSAIRWKDDSLGIDAVFNYGTFNFRTPGFYSKFLRGKLLYDLSVTDFNSFMEEYRYGKRSVVEQDFIIDEKEKQKFTDFLRTNAQPENRSYKYDFFFDNCSTRIRDGLEKSKNTIPVYKSQEQGFTFRDYLHRYLTGKPWVRLGIDLIIGSKADCEASLENQMFLPDRLMSVMTESKLITPPHYIMSFPPEKEARAKAPWFTPNLVIIFIFIVLLLYSFKSPLVFTWLKRTIYFLAFLGGCLIIFLWFFTDHQATKMNWNLLWLNPLYIMLLFGKWKRPIALFLISMVLLGSLSYIFDGLQMMKFCSIYLVLLLCLFSDIVEFNK